MKNSGGQNMLRSMYSGISGMKVNQTKLDVIGNNIANVGTTAFKSSTVRFQDMLSQSVKDAMGPTANQGGINAAQVGLGVQLASIDSVMKQGNMQPTGRSLDVAIDGDGFFMVAKGGAIYGNNTLEVTHTAGSHAITAQSLSNANTELMYSREGAFSLDEAGNLITSDGYRVLGYSLTNDDTISLPTSKSPNGVSVQGLEIRFGPGSALNGYKVVLGNIGAQTVTSADIDKTNKLIVLNGDFSTADALTSAQVESAINKGLSAAGIAQNIYVSGKPSVIANTAADKISGGMDATAPNSVSVGGVTLQFTDGDGLNGYSISIEQVGPPTPSGGKVVAAVDDGVASGTGIKKITIQMDIVNNNITASELKDAINKAISDYNTANPTTAINNNIKNAVGSVNVPQISGLVAGGDTNNAPNAVTVAGLSIALPKGATYNGYKIVLGKVSEGTATAVTEDAANKMIIIDGDFVTPGAVTSSALESAINSTLGLTAPDTATVSGSAKVLSTLSSNSTIDGGSKMKAPAAVQANGLTFTLGEGASLNGYTIQIGKITAGTKSSAEVDTTNKKIIINGDFATAGAITSLQIQNAVNNALQEKGISQAIKVTGTPSQIAGTESNTAEGGSPVQSLDSDGSLYFVDGTKEVKAYDGGLKTLKIPDKVKIPGTDTELKVKTYSIDKSGIITAVLEDGRVAALGQIAMGSFKNPAGLTKLGKNLYAQSANSGEVSVKSGIGTRGDDNSKGFGDNIQGMLEMSNVDLAEQFTDMIVANRAFQASSKMISTGDEILQDIINLKR